MFCNIKIKRLFTFDVNANMPKKMWPVSGTTKMGKYKQLAHKFASTVRKRT
jgi:hypothetical protein